MDHDSTLISIDTDLRVQTVARDLLGHDARLTFFNEDAAVFLRDQPKQSFDLIFADTMPGKYGCLDDALDLVKPAGFYVIDDLLSQPNWPAGHAEKAPFFFTVSHPTPNSKWPRWHGQAEWRSW